MMADDEDWEVKLRVLRLLRAIFVSKLLGSKEFFQLKGSQILKEAVGSIILVDKAVVRL
jgi:hypothetical protein